MPGKATAKIISYNSNMVDICASAARISTTQGNAINIFDEAKNKSNNMELIEKVLKSGHKSVLEHAIFSIAFNEVSVFVEQYIIECRLASFTVKSRRYVDYSNQGYYIPPSLNEEDKTIYCSYMKYLFDGYSQLIELGVPKEDARFLLPYSFCSNFYCTINARELVLLISSIVGGRGQVFPELVDLANQLILQINDLFPAMLSSLPNTYNRATAYTTINNNKSCSNAELRFLHPEELGKIQVLQAPLNPLSVLEFAHSISNSEPSEKFDISTILSSIRPRELEQIFYTFSISSLSLACLTHLVRHRMQSIIIPPFTHVQSKSFVLPNSISENAEAWRMYKNVTERAVELRHEHQNIECLAAYEYYYMLSGNVLNVMTTMNARELQHFMMLRSCNRAQWEIRAISLNMLAALRDHFPLLFSHYGPSCVMQGRCPEGKLSCGKINQVKDAFAHMEW